jgi:hypothetical protein
MRLNLLPEALSDLNTRLEGRSLADAVMARSGSFPDHALAGEAAAVRLGNCVAGIVDLLAIWRRGLVPLVIPAELNDRLVAQALEHAGARLAANPYDLVRPSEETPAQRNEGVLLQSSGSTGERKLFFRTASSLLAEGARYRAIWGDLAGKEVALLAPVHHAFALGALLGCLVSGARVRLVEPSHLSACTQAIQECDLGVLTPGIARLLAQRAGSRSQAERARAIVIAGAGPVDQALDAEFEAAFGIRLARNYGSAETGALLYGEAGLPPLVTGRPMAGVRCRIAGDGTRAGRLSVMVEGNGEPAWHDMGDIACQDRDGLITIMGRADHTIRRGERFVPHFEIESAVLAMPGVRAARARREILPSGTDRFVLDIWPHELERFDARSFQTALATSFAPQDLPDRIEARSIPPMTQSGKMVHKRHYRPAPANILLKAANAYKRARLLFALYQLGVFDALGEGDLDAVAQRCGLDVGRFEFALALAERFGLVEPAEAGAPWDDEADSILAFEAFQESGTNSIGAIKAALKEGQCVALDVDGFRARYAGVMTSRSLETRARLVLRAIGALAPPPRLVVEVGFSTPLYLRLLPPAWKGARCLFLPLGGIEGEWEAGERAIEIIQPGDLGGESIDLALFARSLHWPDSGKVFREIFGRLEQVQGRIVIDDIFLDNSVETAEMAIDWLSHASLSFADAGGFEQFATTLGARFSPLHVAGIEQSSASGSRILMAKKG